MPAPTAPRTRRCPARCERRRAGFSGSPSRVNVPRRGVPAPRPKRPHPSVKWPPGPSATARPRRLPGSRAGRARGPGRAAQSPRARRASSFARTPRLRERGSHAPRRTRPDRTRVLRSPAAVAMEVDLGGLSARPQDLASRALNGVHNPGRRRTAQQPLAVSGVAEIEAPLPRFAPYDGARGWRGRKCGW